MGESMCANLIKANLGPVWAYDVVPEKAQQMLALGAKAATSPEEVADNANVIVIMVPNSQHVEAVVGGLLPKLKKGTIVVDMSTISPNVSRALAQKIKAAGCQMIDAPVVKSKAAAEAGDLGILVGGDAEVLDRVKPLLEKMGSQIIHLGPNGNGLVMKLCHNSLVAQIQNGVNEMIVLAQASGISIDKFVSSIAAGGGQNFYLDKKWETIKTEYFSPKFPFEHMDKDVKLTQELADSLALFLPGLKNVLQVYETGIVKKLNREDFSAAYKVVKDQAKQ